MMTLDEAIEHCKERARLDCSDCAAEHEQLAKWLEELKRYKEHMTDTVEKIES